MLALSAAVSCGAIDDNRATIDNSVLHKAEKQERISLLSWWMCFSSIRVDSHWSPSRTLWLLAPLLRVLPHGSSVCTADPFPGSTTRFARIQDSPEQARCNERAPEMKQRKQYIDNQKSASSASL